MIRIREASTPADFETARALFLEYAQSLSFSLCFQSFDKELEEIDRQYAGPGGVLLLALHADGTALGCVGVRRIDDAVAELKRMYVKPAARGLGLGKRLLDEALQRAMALGYAAIRLDTLPEMGAAIQMYQTSGFQPIAPYTRNPVEGALFLEKSLASGEGLAGRP